MHQDLARADLTDRDSDICIIGAGAAGITAARRLLAAGRSVTLLESGGLDYEAEIADLNAGENIGERYYELEHSRLRFFGGTTAIWGGRLAELDPIDLRKRDWVPHSGWPLTMAELQSYYREAWGLFDLPARAPQPGDFGQSGVWLPPLDGDQLELKTWAFDSRFNRFTFASCRDVVDHPRCTVVTHATVTSIELNESGKAVASLTVRSPSGASLSLRARAFVLAAGGIENPRLLLASRSRSGRGVGNEHDLVGRFFMEHPHARGGRIVSDRAWSWLKAFGRRHRIDRTIAAALIAPSERSQATSAMLNTSLTVASRQPPSHSQFWGMRAYNRVKHDLAPTRGARALWMSTKKAATTLQSVVDPLRPWLMQKVGLTELALLVRAEQAPNPDSRITLSDETDAFGTPRARLDWRFSDIDVHSVDRLVDLLGTECERLGLGRVEPAEWLSSPDRRWRFDPLVSAHPIGGYHHMGTTRMSDDPRQGVTDADGRVHGVANLFIAGSSLFPTSGWANPTLTIVALALRTADRIASDRDLAR